jgi:uncharacterized protein (TIGR03435 family)
MSLYARVTLPVLLACSSFGQTPTFEVASIRPSASFDGAGKVNLGTNIDGAQVHFYSLSLREYLARAYGTKAPMIAGPDWTASETFDISATLPAGATPAQIPEMLQALLADRFHVKLHKEKKEFRFMRSYPAKVR